MYFLRCVLLAVMTFGCTAEMSTFEGQSWWHVRVWIKDSGHEILNKIYSIRYGNEQSKALKDCDRWMKEERKDLKKLPAGNVKPAGNKEHTSN